MKAIISAINDSKITNFGDDEWRIVNSDCLKILPLLPDKSVDLIFADPPYNLQLKNELYRRDMSRVDGVSDDWDKFNSFEEYDNFSKQWLFECKRILSDTGSIWVIGTYHNIGRLTTIMQDLGYWIQNDVIWQKTNPMPNFRGVRFTNSTETLIWAKPSEKKSCVFNYKTMKNENGGKQMTNIWKFSTCVGKERLRDENGKKLHSTQKPESLLRRIILSSSKKDSIVLDPFSGSGTTLSVAKKLNRMGIGIERDKSYVDISVKRVLSSKKEDISDEIIDKPLKRVAFSELLSGGFLNEGDILFNKKKENKVVVLSDGNVQVKGGCKSIGSIHKISRLLEKIDSCNGWTYWYVQKDTNDIISIDEFRKTIRSNSDKKPETKNNLL